MDLVAIGCSSGGLHALQTLLRGLAPSLPAALVVVCHTASEDVSLLCELLARHSTLPVCEASERQTIQPGRVYVAPTNYHLLIDSSQRFLLSVDSKVCFVRPSIDVLFESAADVYGEKMIGVVLTGANHDGAQGLKRIRGQGGLAIVQNPADAEFSTMPQAALEHAGADQCLDLAAIAAEINRICLS